MRKIISPELVDLHKEKFDELFHKRTEDDDDVTIIDNDIRLLNKKLLEIGGSGELTLNAGIYLDGIGDLVKNNPEIRAGYVNKAERYKQAMEESGYEAEYKIEDLNNHYIYFKFTVKRK